MLVARYPMQEPHLNLASRLYERFNEKSLLKL